MNYPLLLILETAKGDVKSYIELRVVWIPGLSSSSSHYDGKGAMKI